MAASPGDGHGLGSRLAAVLPKGRRFGFHHLSTPPLKTAALCSAPPGQRPDRTYCEKHFLAVSVGDEAVLVLGLEVLVYSTAHATTLFVSKADSTGFLGLAALPPRTPSPVRHICAAVVGHLAETRRRKGVPLVVSLFARAQDQYLFPGSVKHSGKHVLDDRALIRWWCRVLDPLLAGPAATGYLLIPGLDGHETRALVPRPSSARWLLGHPLERISHYSREFDWVPPRCLIPRFPDDPKSRFRDELDEEAAHSGSMQTLGSWKSVKTLDAFWDVMGFRQECSSGRMTGFIWLVYDEAHAEPHAEPALALATPSTPTKNRAAVEETPNTTPRKLFRQPSPGTCDNKTGKEEGIEEEDDEEEEKKKKKKKKKKLKGRIVSRRPHIKTRLRNHVSDQPMSSKYYIWPLQGRGGRIVDDDGYKRAMELLLHLDFSTHEKAAGSSRRWIGESQTGGVYGLEVTGTCEVAPGPDQAAASGQATAPVNNLSGLVKRKRAETTESQDDEAKTEAKTQAKTLGPGLVRKKAKT